MEGEGGEGVQACRQGGFEGVRSNPPKDFIYTAIVHFKCPTVH